MSEIINRLFSRISVEEQKTLAESFMSSSFSDESRVAFALKILNEELNFIPTAQNKTKSSADSTRLKNEGNQIFLSKRDATLYMKAWELYSKSIAFAPNNSQELALAFANRSAVLLHLRKYSEALQDIQRALNLNYPDHLKPKLLLRKAECLALLGSSELPTVYEETLSLFNEMSLDNSNQEKLRNKLTAATKLKKDKDLSDSDPVLPTIVPQNEIPCASEALALKYNTRFGRHVVTTRKIKTGEILSVEEPYSLMLALGNMYTHCAHCLKVAWASVPCEHCVYVLYCSENCRDLAWKKYHDIECPITGQLLNITYLNELSEFFTMRLTILAVREFGTLEKLKAEMVEVDSCNDPRLKGFSQDGKLRSDKFRSIYSLVTNTEKRPFCDLFGRAHHSAIILYLMATCSTFFGKTFQKNDFKSLLQNEDVMFIGGLLLRHHQIIPTNIHFFEELRDLDFKERGLGAFPFHSFLNHSCSPNVSRFGSGKHMVMYALHPIEKDTQLFDSYGLSYGQSTKDERRAKLAENYYFQCECVPCQKDWPFPSKLHSYEVLVKSVFDKIKIQMALLKVVAYFPLITKERLADKPNILNDLIQMIEIFLQYVPLYCIEFGYAIETLKQVIAENGNRFEVPKLK